MPISSINPANGTILRSFDALTTEAVTSKIAEADQAFRRYRETALEHRVMWMKKLAGILEQEMEELATLLTMEVGKTISASREEILNCAACCRYYAENAARLLEDEAIGLERNSCVVRWQPMGIVLALMPWNSPFWQVFRFMVPALLGGNVALLKHASNVPQCALEMELLMRRAGFPRGVFQSLLIQDWQVEAVLSDERVTAVTVTGSEAMGRAIAAQAGWLLKKSVLELWTSDAFLVMPSANLFAAIQAGVRSRCLDNGQSCMAAMRFLVHEAVYDEFEALFAAAMEDVKVGNPLKDETEMGPLATEQVMDALEKQIAAAMQAGGRLVTGGQRMVGEGNFFEPTVIADVPREATVCREEIFGPVAMLFKVASVEEAVALANDSPHGVGASVWTQDQEEQARLAAQLECGTVFVNTAVMSDPRVPVGGVKRSGYGRELTAAAVREFMTLKTVLTADVACEQEMDFERMLQELDVDAPSEASMEVEADEMFEAVPVRAEELKDEFADELTVSNAGMVEVAAVSQPRMVVERVAVAAPMEKAAPPVFAMPLTTQVQRQAETAASVEVELKVEVRSFKEMFQRALEARG